MQKQKSESGRFGVIGTIVLIVLSVLLLPVLIVNLTLIVKGSLNKDVPPDVFGIAPLTVVSGSMQGDNEDSFDIGALIFVDLLSDEEKDALEIGDVVTYKTGDIYVTHRIQSIDRGEGGEIVTLVTQGDANSMDDGDVPIADVVGKLIGSVEGLGNFALFLQTPAGILVFVGIPVLAYAAFELIQTALQNKRVRQSEASAIRDKDEEIRRLRALVEQGEGRDGAQTEGGAQSEPASEEPQEEAKQDTGNSEKEG